MSGVFAHLRLPANCHDCFDVSRDGRRLATGYHYVTPSHIDVWDVATGRVVASIGKTYASDVSLCADHRHVIWWSSGGKPGTWIHDFAGPRTEKLKGAFAPSNGTWTRDGRTLLLRRHRGRGGLRLTFEPRRISPLPLPGSRNVWHLAGNPAEDTFVVREGDFAVSCLYADNCQLVWRRRVPETGWVCCTGDGRFVALEQHAPAGGGAARIVVLDARSGEIVRKIEQPEQGRFPLDGPRVLCLSGRFANLETGEIEPGVSDIRRWYALIGYPECNKDRPMGEFEKWSHDQARRLGADEF